MRSGESAYMQRSAGSAGDARLRLEPASSAVCDAALERFRAEIDDDCVPFHKLVDDGSQGL
jgi:hypothetical protein